MAGFNLHRSQSKLYLDFYRTNIIRNPKWRKRKLLPYRRTDSDTNCTDIGLRRGGPSDIMENYWLTDDAMDSSAGCYTEGMDITQLNRFYMDFWINRNKTKLLLNLKTSTIRLNKRYLLAMGA